MVEAAPILAMADAKVKSGDDSSKGARVNIVALQPHRSKGAGFGHLARTTAYANLHNAYHYD